MQLFEIELTQERINELMERNKRFEQRQRKAEELKIMRADLAEEVEYAEQCEDVHTWVTKSMRDWEHETLSKPMGWDKTLEGVQTLKLFRETRRVFWNLYETLMQKVRACHADLQQAAAQQVLPHRALLSAQRVRARQRQIQRPGHRQRALAHRSHHGRHPRAVRSRENLHFADRAYGCSH